MSQSVSDVARANLKANTGLPETGYSNVDLFFRSTLYNTGLYAGLSAGEGYERYLATLSPTP